MSFNYLTCCANMTGKNSEKDVWLTYCEECVKSKIDKNVPQEYKEEPGETADTNL